MSMNRRAFMESAVALAMLSATDALAAGRRSITLVLAPSNLGLRPPRSGHQPGTWQAPQVLMQAGLRDAVGAREVISLERPAYAFEQQPGTRIRNGQSIRAFSLQLGSAVEGVLRSGGFPLVIGGDCSILLGGLYGLRRSGGRGLVHVDGHSDFYQMSKADAGRLGAAAGMDLALASGRGEPLLTHWPQAGVLANDPDIIQIGDREAQNDNGQIPASGIAQITAQHVLADGISAVVATASKKLETAHVERAWLHVDLDVLDEKVMDAVDSPGSPGLNFEQLGDLVHGLCASGHIAGADFSIYDPELDAGLRFAKPIVDCIARGVGAMGRPLV